MTTTTTPATTTAAPPSALEELASKIRMKHRDMLTQFKTSVTTAIEVGELLEEAKARVKHGNFEAWVKDHCQFSYRSARRYMGMAKNKTKLLAQLNAPSEALGDLSAQKLLAAPPGGSNNNKNDSDK